MTDHNPDLYGILTELNERPPVFSIYTAETLWNDEYISRQMLACHLDPESLPASRPHNFIERSANWIIDRFDLAGGKRIADFGCGPGLYTSRFAATGSHVTGIDFSDRSIEYAKQDAVAKGLDIDYIKADYLEVDLQRKFDLITMIYCDLCALSPTQRQTLLRKFASLLSVDGYIMLDVFSMRAFGSREESRVFGPRTMGDFWSSGDYWGLTNTFKYEKEKVGLDKHVVIEPKRTRVIYNWLQYFSLERLTRELKDCGLRINERYGNIAGDPTGESDDTIAIVAERI
ncbi:MAG: class I SAM-dependent methyltransferase [bacterium]|nr:class I SAM-dependent methyltransferase [bacterium]